MQDDVQLRNEIFAGGGETGALMRALEWSRTPLGPVQTWPQSLRTVVRILLTSRFAMWMGWGPELTFLYNDAYAHMTLGKKHPWALGKPSHEVWAEIWPDVGPRIRKVLNDGEATWDEALLLFLERSGYTEETYHTFSYSPLTDDNGKINGHLCVVSEETDRIINERRLSCLSSLAGVLGSTITETEVLSNISRGLDTNTRDLPFTLTYLFEQGSTRARLACATGIEPGHPIAPVVVELDSEAIWPFPQVLKSDVCILTELRKSSVDVPKGIWDRPPIQAAAIHIAPSGKEGLAGVLISGLNPFRQFDESYKSFLTLVAGGISASIANARAYEQERKRAEALAEVDRAKTIFFSNVSHEFRTPLTLMLGPTEDALSTPQQSLHGKALETVHRNELRLLKLVNTLLDFSRLEAGRISASFRPTDLAAYTAELASVFRSAVERAQLSYVVDATPLPQLVYIDREMWEKIVLNLLSNALKSTFEGAIVVKVSDAGDHAEIQVSDTGTGIPQEEIPTLFERFRRIENARRRTHEGSGIGLALANELVKMHGGEITVRSTVNKGSSFTVSLPYGTGHLPSARVKTDASLHLGAAGRAAFVQEAISWLPGTQATLLDGAVPDIETAGELLSGQAPGRVLLVDDNIDMLDYVRQLLAGRFQVTTAPNGRLALEMALKNVPELVLSDVMMPEMDGFQLLHELRRNPLTQSVPVILLSARAGEESRVEGMEAGADDYLIKPFTARELVARVDAHLKIARFRRDALEKELKLRQELDEARRLAAEAVENISDGFFMYDRQWRLTYANPAAERVGVVNGRDGLVGTTLWQAFPDLAGTDMEVQFRRCMEARVPVEFEMLHGLRYYATRVYPSPDGGIVSYVADVTARRRAEAALRLKQEHMQLAQRAAGIASWELDMEAEELTISQEFAEMIGLPGYVSRLRYVDFLNSLFLSSDRTAAQSAMQQALRGKKEFSVELRLKRPDGSVRLVSSRGKGFYNQGKPLVLGVLVDITPEDPRELARPRARRARKKTLRKT
jgi:signal transduction histidine kinase/CheY-like chemotaxis protein